MNSKYQRLLLACLMCQWVTNIHCYFIGQRSETFNANLKRLLVRRQTCSDSSMCLSKWGYCGTTADYCGDGCQAGPCTGTGTGTGTGQTGGGIINDSNFACAFNDLDDSTRAQRLDGLQQSGYQPGNADEAAVFLAHVYHETGGLSTLTENCAPGKSRPISKITPI